MAIWQWALLAIALLWGLQSIGVWYQMRHYSDVMKGITSKYSDGYVGAGHVRGWLGKGVIVLIVVDRNLVVRRFLQMSGRSVFVKFKRREEFEGVNIAQLSELAALNDGANEIKIAAKQAVDQIQRMQAQSDGRTLEGLKTASA